MPDISMCLGRNCKDRDGCYRYTATPDTYTMPDGRALGCQTFADFDIHRTEDSCEFFWKQHNENNDT